MYTNILLTSAFRYDTAFTSIFQFVYRPHQFLDSLSVKDGVIAANK